MVHVNEDLFFDLFRFRSGFRLGWIGAYGTFTSAIKRHLFAIARAKRRVELVTFRFCLHIAWPSACPLWLIYIDGDGLGVQTRIRIPNLYCAQCVDIAQTQTQILTPYFCRTGLYPSQSPAI